MRPALRQAIEVNRGHIKARWVQLLRLDPVFGRLESADSLERFCDDILREMNRALTARAEGAKNNRRPLDEWHRQCCRSPIRRFFVAGGKAVREAVALGCKGAVAQERIMAIEEVWNGVAEDRLRRFCVVCQLCARCVEERRRSSTSRERV